MQDQDAGDGLMAARGESFHTADIEMAEHLLSNAYGTTVSLRGSGGQRGEMRVTRDPLGLDVRLDRHALGMHLDFTGTSLGAVVICHLRSGRLCRASGNSQRLHRAGDVFLAAQPEHSYTGRLADSDTEAAVIPAALLAEVASPAPGRAPQSLRLTSYEPVSLQAAAIWKATYAHARTIARDPEASRHPLLTSSVAQLLATVTLATFPSNTLDDPTIEDRHDAHPATLRRAMTFIHDNAHRVISSADIAAAAHVTIRAVQLSFQRYLATTPTEYLRRVRLAGAHHALTGAIPGDGTTVTAVAYQWGFSNSSQFTARYRQAYGVTPSRTLRQHWPSPPASPLTGAAEIVRVRPATGNAIRE